MSTPHWTVINASAGSGKTYRLAELLTEMLSKTIDGQPVFHPSEVIATTFTRDAAAELKSRIRDGLVADAHNAWHTHGDAARRDLLLDQAAGLPAALIGTVNSVSGSILNDYALDAGRSPRPVVLDEESQPRVFSLATDDIIAAVQQEHGALLQRMDFLIVDSGAPFDPRSTFTDTVREIVDQARGNDIDASQLHRHAQASIDLLRQALVSQYQEDDRISGAPVRPRVLRDIDGMPDRLRKGLANGAFTSKRDINSIEKALPKLEDLAMSLRGKRDTVSWRTLMQICNGETLNSTAKPVVEAYQEMSTWTDFALDEQFARDISATINLVFDTAAKCLNAYQDYKHLLGLIDFTDQEHLLHQLLTGDDLDEDTFASVNEGLRQRFRVLIVDEFQDTSPLQLALFTQIAATVEKVVWVGDPKQSIYAFRGADPALMDDALAAITALPEEQFTQETQAFSWRTHDVPLEVSNKIFGRLFGQRHNVHLSVPEAKRTEHQGGDAVVWPQRDGEKGTDFFERIADGLEELQTQHGTPDKGRAVLVATNKDAESMREVLREKGIPVSGGGNDLLSTREGQLFRAGLAWLLDEGDTQALVELIVLTPDHPAHHTWLETLTGLPDRAARQEQLHAWGDEECFRPLATLRNSRARESVTDAVVGLIDALDLRARTAARKRSSEATTAVTGVLSAAREYTDQALGAGEPVSLDGFHDYLVAGEATTTASGGAGGVTVATVHKSKGLEWDDVIVALKKPSREFQPAGIWIGGKEKLDLTAPLAGRTLFYWPDTLGRSLKSTKYSPDEHEVGRRIDEVLAEAPSQVSRRIHSNNEATRLLYVAMTRSKQCTVLAPKTTLSDWAAFNVAGLSDKEILGLADLAIHDPQASAEHPDWLTGTRDVAAELDRQRQSPPRPPEFVSANFAPSDVQATQELLSNTEMVTVAELGPALVRSGAPEWERVGEAVHHFLAAPYALLSDDEAREVAQRLVVIWGVASLITDEVILTAAQRWDTWVQQTYPGSTIRTEVPFTWHNALGQRAQGWIDQIIDTDAGPVIVDHKANVGGSGKLLATRMQERYVGQLETYRQVLIQTPGVPDPVGVLIHLPLSGVVMEMRPRK